MVIGFKTGPRNWEEGKRIVAEDGAQMCELWFNVLNAEKYKGMIGWLAKRGVTIGLHHWGLVQDKYKTNLATNNNMVRDETIRQIKQTIDIGQAINCTYVNIHPGAQCLETMDFDRYRQAIVPSTRTPLEQAHHLLRQAVTELNDYASSRGVILTVETLPGAENELYEAGQGRYDPGNIRLAVMAELGAAGVRLANDITHTAGQLALQDPDVQAVWKSLLVFTRQTALYTTLLHINTVRPPLDGTDEHRGITDGDWHEQVFPARDQIKAILRMFERRSDVYVVPEPRTNTRGNFLALAQLAHEV